MAVAPLSSSRSALALAVLIAAVVLSGCTTTDPPDQADEDYRLLSVVELPPIGQFTPTEFADVSEEALMEQEITWEEFNLLRSQSAPSRERHLQGAELQAATEEIQALQSLAGNWTKYDGVLFQFRIMPEGPVYRYAIGRAVL